MKIKITVCSIFFASLTFSQKPIDTKDLGSYAANFNKGNEMIDENQNLSALDYFLFAYKYDSTNANINFHIGDLYLKHPSKKHLAERYLEKAVTNMSKKYKDYDAKELHAPMIALLQLGKAYHLDYKFNLATEHYDKFESLMDKDDKYSIMFLEHYKEQVKHANYFITKPVAIRIHNMGETVNSVFPDFSPVLSADEKTMIFTHRGPVLNSDGYSPADGWVFENVMISQKLDDSYPGKWTKPQSISPYVNSGVTHEGSVGLSADGQTLIVYRDDEGDGNLYYCNWNGAFWGGLTKFGSNINTPFWEPSACLTSDGKTLYFISDREGGIGGRDIYMCKKLPNGAWGKAVNMGPSINTPYNEESPFVTPDGQYMYFSSEGHSSMGGFDIMYTKIDENGKTDSIINLGYPVNTTDDDLYFVVSPDAKRGYFASGHEGGVGEKDLYMIELNLPKPTNLALYRGKFLPAKCDSIPDNISVTISDLRSNEIVGTYKPKLPDGNFVAILQAKKEYVMSFNYNDKDYVADTIRPAIGEPYQVIDKAFDFSKIKVGSLKDSLALASKLTLIISLEDAESGEKLNNINLNLNNKNSFQKTNTVNSGKAVFSELSANSLYALHLDTNVPYDDINDIVNTDCLFRNDTLFRTYKLKKKEISIAGNDYLATFKHFFTYNKNEIDMKSTEYLAFIDKIKSGAKAGKKLIIDYYSSASNVPTRAFRDNKTLAKSRIEVTKGKIEKNFTEYGITEFITNKQEFGVNGPEYKNDKDTNMPVYEKYQYIEIKVKFQ